MPRYYEVLAEIKAAAREWREKLDRQDRWISQTTYWLYRTEDLQKDYDEYREEMSLGGSRYDPLK